MNALRTEEKLKMSKYTLCVPREDDAGGKKYQFAGNFQQARG